jgi:hypothetical protein
MAKMLPTVSRQLTWLEVAAKVPVCHAPAVVWKFEPQARTHPTDTPTPVPQSQVPEVISPPVTVIVLYSQVFADEIEYSATYDLFDPEFNSRTQ